MLKSLVGSLDAHYSYGGATQKAGVQSYIQISLWVVGTQEFVL